MKSFYHSERCMLKRFSNLFITPLLPYFSNTYRLRSSLLWSPSLFHSSSNVGPMFRRVNHTFPFMTLHFNQYFWINILRVIIVSYCFSDGLARIDAVLSVFGSEALCHLMIKWRDAIHQHRRISFKFLVKVFFYERVVYVLHGLYIIVW